MTISERISYIKGLAEGIALDDKTKEGKVLLSIIDLLQDMVDEIDAIDETVDEIAEQVDAVDEDLAAIEDDFYGDDEEDDDDDLYDDYHDDEVYEVECPRTAPTAEHASNLSLNVIAIVRIAKAIAIQNKIQAINRA